MTDEPEKRMACAVGRMRPIEETHPHLKEFVAFLGEFNKETPRGACLAAPAFSVGHRSSLQNM